MNGWDLDYLGDEDKTELQWTFAGALLYSITVITTIGQCFCLPVFHSCTQCSSRCYIRQGNHVVLSVINSVCHSGNRTELEPAFWEERNRTRTHVEKTYIKLEPNRTEPNPSM